MSKLDKLLAEGQEASHLDLPDDAVGERRNSSAAQVYSLRLPSEAVSRLEALAEERGIPAATLARGMVLRGLSEADGGLGVALDRASAELKRVRDLIGH